MKLAAVTAVAAALVVPIACAVEPTIGTLDQAEIGVCGANLDPLPLPGVVCDYAWYYPRPGVMTLASAEAYVEDGFDYVHCNVDITCVADGTAYDSTNTVVCHHAAGTGCQPRTTVVRAVVNWKLDAGTQADQLLAFCRARNNFISPQAECRRHPGEQIEQGEDLCCVERKPGPGSGSGSGSGSAN